MSVQVRKPRQEDLNIVREILRQWTKNEEVEKYVRRISDEIGGQTEFNQRFWVADLGGEVVGVGGLSDPLPRVIPLAESENPGEIKILYVDEESHGQGIGKGLVGFLEEEAISQNYSELLVRSALKYKNTGWGFYERLGYQKCGQIAGGKNGELMQVFRKRLNE